MEIDESVIARRKYHRGHRVPERWVFGGTNPESNLGFLALVDDRSAATPLTLIQQFIGPGSIIHSDEWAAYIVEISDQLKNFLPSFIQK